MLLGIAHIVGALVASVAFGMFVAFIAEWEQRRILVRRMQDAALALNVSVADLEANNRHIPQLLAWLAGRYSDELLRNRLADVCGAIRTAWNWLGGLVQLGFFVGAVWSLFSDSARDTAFVWAAPASCILFWLGSVGFSFSCRVLTGRFPGEAKAGRSSVAKQMQELGTAGNVTAPT